MKAGFQHKAAVIAGLLLLSSFVAADWVQLNSGTTAELYSVHFPEGTQVGYAVGAGQDSTGGMVGVVLKTTNRGDTWQMQNVGHVNVLNSVYFVNDDSGYAVGQRGLALRTPDGGATWTAMTVPDTDNLTRVQFPENGLTGYIGVYPESGAQVLKTTNGGDSWTSIAVGGPMNKSYSCAMATDNIGVVLGRQGMVYGTTDGCSTFAAQGPQTAADLVAAAFSPEDPNKGYLIGNDTLQGIIRYTDDFGVPLWDSARCYPIRAYHGIDMPTDDAAYVCGTDGRIDRSITSINFVRTRMPTGLTATLYSLSFPNGPDTGYAVGASGVVLRTCDGGIPWGG